MRVLIYMAAICLFSAEAHAAKMIDMSLSPAESFKEPSSVDTNVPGLGGSGAPASSGKVPSQLQGAALPVSPRFMDTYCRSDLPMEPGSDALSVCLRKTHEEACARFQRLPEEAKQIVDDKILCTNPSMRLDDGSAPSAACKTLNDSYVQALETFSKDADTVQSMAAVPGMVNNPASMCSQ